MALIYLLDNSLWSHVHSVLLVVVSQLAVIEMHAWADTTIRFQLGELYTDKTTLYGEYLSKYTFLINSNTLELMVPKRHASNKNSRFNISSWVIHVTSVQDWD